MECGENATMSLKLVHLVGSHPYTLTLILQLHCVTESLYGRTLAIAILVLALFI